MGDIVVGGDQVAAELDDPGVVLVDVRPPHDVGELLNRLENRCDGGFGDYAAVMTESAAPAGGPPP